MFGSIASMGLMVLVSVPVGYYALKKGDIESILDTSEITIVDNNGVLKDAIKKHKLENEKFMKYIKNYEDVIYKKDYLNKYMYEKNISMTKILYFDDKEKKAYKNKKSTGRGYYSFKKGEIRLLGEETINDIYHELIHLSTSFENDNTLFCGFEQTDKKEGYKIGTGLNEGFTELLNTIYFNKESKAYQPLRIFANALSEIIGLEKMEKYFYNADLLSLSKEMQRYGITEKEVYRFLANMDFCCYFYKKDKVSFIDNKQYQKSIDEVQELLIRMYMNRYILDAPTTSDDYYRIIKEKGIAFANGSFFKSYDLKEDASKLIKDRKVIVMDDSKAKEYVDNAIEEARKMKAA